MVDKAGYCLCKVVGVKKSLEEKKEKEENVGKKVSKGMKETTEHEKGKAKNGKKPNRFNSSAATEEVDPNGQGSQQFVWDESVIEDASGPKEEIELTNETQESEQSDAETEVVDDIEDTRLAALSTGAVLTNSRCDLDITENRAYGHTD